MLTVVVGSKEESVISSLSLVSLGSNAVILRIPSLEMKSVFVVFLFVVLLFDNSLVKLEIPLVFLCTGIYRYLALLCKAATVNQQLVLPVYIYMFIYRLF